MENTLALDPAPSPSDLFQLRAYGFFLALTRKAEEHSLHSSGAEPSLGGNLLYTGELSANNQALVAAANVAGCATLATAAEPSMQKQVIREGIVDFVVTSLDEGLRILKNEIRKRNAVAVCVGLDSAAVKREMIERGVQPDLVFAGLDGSERSRVGFETGSREIKFAEPDRGLALITWRVSEAPARWMPKLDAIALACLTPDSWEHRWIRLSPRYCGRSAMSQRIVYCGPEVAREILGRFSDSVQRDEIATEIAVRVASGEESKVFRLRPRGVTQNED